MRQVKSFPRSSWSPLLGPTSVPSCKRTHAKFFYLANDDKFVISSRLLTQNEDIPAKLCSNVNLNSLCPALLFVKLLHEGSSQPGGKKARGKVSVHKYFSAFSQTFLSSATHFFWWWWLAKTFQQILSLFPVPPFLSHCSVQYLFFPFRLQYSPPMQSNWRGRNHIHSIWNTLPSFKTD